MHLESKTPMKEMVQLNESLVHERRPSCLEEDLALSSSRDESINEKTITETEDKSLDLPASESPRSSLLGKSETDVQPAEEEEEEEEETARSSPRAPLADPLAVVYVSEDAMDCNYDESSLTTGTAVGDDAPVLSGPPTANLQLWTASRHFELPEDQPSPEMFESDADDEAETSTNTTATSVTTATTATTTTTCPSLVTGQSPDETGPSQTSPLGPTPEEMILRADKFLLRQVNKYLSGVPPPPSHTISQKDCDDFLVYIKQNRSYFWADPFLIGETADVEPPSFPLTSTQNDEAKGEDTCASSSSRTSQSKAGMRNLSTAFDACEKSFGGGRPSQNDSSVIDPDFLDSTSCSFSLSDSLFNSSILSASTFAATQTDEDAEIRHRALPTLYTSIKPEEVAKLDWKEAYTHRCPEIYYNRNRALEDFENLRMKLCDRYVGNETQSTCNVWFAKQMPTSARKRSLLAKRNNGQSPGKRLSYLAKRRRTFSSANLQVLNFPEKKLMLNIRKGQIRKGKSPRGKSPRGKSPRGKTPRSSAKKRYIKRLQLEGPSPRKVKLETSKRALFQSPPADRAGPSREVATATVTSATATNNNPRKIKRALFPTPKKNDVTSDNLSESLSYPESRKRKSEEELENPKQKWSKSLSFDCSHNIENNSTNPNSVRHSTSNVGSKYSSSSGKGELSDIHRKKLLWAVAEALRSQGIGMNHPQFKSYGSALARTVRKFMPDLVNKNIPRKPGSTTDRMIKIAKRHVLLLVDGKPDV